jgi:hypothetical protein
MKRGICAQVPFDRSFVHFHFGRASLNLVAFVVAAGVTVLKTRPRRPAIRMVVLI